MSNFGLALAVFIGLVLVQIFLSTRQNKFLGLIIPGINGLFSVVVASLLTDIYTALIGLMITAIPIIIWLRIYAVCRRNLEKKNHAEITRMKIQDL
ncbi:MAG: hypothetical protein AB9891_15705 [Anaerolineaceae bacterium]